MKKEVKEALKDELGLVRKSKVKLFTGVIMILLSIAFVVTQYLSVYCLLFLLPLLYVIRKEIMEYRLNSAVLMLTRYLIDDDYSKEFDEENNLKSQ